MKGFWRLLSRIRDYRKEFILSVVCNILMAIFTVISIPLLIPFFQILFERIQTVPIHPTGLDINEWVKYYLSDMIVVYGKDTALIWVCISLVIVFLLKNVFRYYALYFMAPLRNGIIYDLRKQLYTKYLELPLSFYSNERKGALLSSMTVDVQEIEWSILSVIEAIFKAPIIMTGCIIFMLFISPSLTLFVLILVVFAGLIIGRIVTSLKQSSVDVQNQISNITAHVEETLGSLRIIKGFNAEKYQQNKFDKENIQFRQTLTNVIQRRDMAAPVSEFLGVSVITILMWYGSHLVFKNTLQPETFFAFVFAFYQVIEPAKSLSAAYFSIQKGMAALDRLDRVMNTHNDIQSKEDAIRNLSFEKEIRFENVSFAYKDNEVNALENINLTIKKGQVIALVGTSGAGKSTFVDLLSRFYDVTVGKITIDGKDICDLNLQDLRQLFGIVTQDAILFHDTIANNITFGIHQYTEEQIREAAEIANAHDFISVLPAGYDTSIGDRGLKLSGGQRQRLTIARAILRNPPVLILDEATSALDSESERLVQDALHKIMKNRTSVVIAHRLSTIQEADLILVLEEGRIVQSGTHQELSKIKGPYKKFVEMQTFSK